MKNYNGYQPSIGKGFDNFDNIAAELEAQIAAGVIAPMQIPEAAQEQAAEAAAELQEMIAWAEGKIGHAFSEARKQAIARTRANNKLDARGLVNTIVSIELASKQS